jgi:hypothetical protein
MWQIVSEECTTSGMFQLASTRVNAATGGSRSTLTASAENGNVVIATKHSFVIDPHNFASDNKIWFLWMTIQILGKTGCYSARHSECEATLLRFMRGLCRDDPRTVM